MTKKPQDDSSPAPDFDDNALLVSIARSWRADLSDEELYDATRGHWRVGAETRRHTAHVFGFESWIIRSAYVVESWFPSKQGGEGDRWGFVGHVNQDLDRYIGTSVQHLFKPGARPYIRKVLRRP